MGRSRHAWSILTSSVRITGLPESILPRSEKQLVEPDCPVRVIQPRFGGDRLDPHTDSISFMVSCQSNPPRRGSGRGHGSWISTITSGCPSFGSSPRGHQRWQRLAALSVLTGTDFSFLRPLASRCYRNRVILTLSTFADVGAWLW